MNNCLEEISRAITNHQDILVSAHILPDGDSIGSVLGLALGLDSIGKNVVVVLQDKIPNIYQFLPGVERIVEPTAVTIKPHLMIVLDCSDLGRLGSDWYHQYQNTIPIINLDHHISNDFFGTLNHVDVHAAATAEIVYQLLIVMNIPITEPIATALYTGIISDTGSFRYDNTTPHTLRLAANLLSQGVDLGLIKENIYENRSLVNLKVIAEALNRLEVSEDGKVAWIALSAEKMAALGAEPQHTDNIVNYCISVSGVKVGMLFRETDHGLVKVSFRSKLGYDVNRLAQKFGGGGHIKAAGCVLSGPLAHAINQVLAAIKECPEE